MSWRALEVWNNLHLEAAHLTKSGWTVFGFCPAGAAKCQVGSRTAKHVISSEALVSSSLDNKRLTRVQAIETDAGSSFPQAWISEKQTFA